MALRCAGDDARGLAAALACGADALVIEGPVPPDLRDRIGAAMLIHALDGPDAALPTTAPDAILLDRARSGRDVAALGARLAVHEAEHGWPDGGLPILAQIGDPLGVLEARSFVGASPRLAGLGLDTVALADALGAEAAGETVRQARGLVRLAAAAAGVTALVTLAPDGIEAARRDGFELLITRDPEALSSASP
ncbi:aldolase [Methylorubrum sp. POS3]|uniref:aldolase n=1 Tax=Methylorubrum sp. POS3 TaxID=2998492 RepID=UPI00372A92BC